MTEHLGSYFVRSFDALAARHPEVRTGRPASAASEQREVTVFIWARAVRDSSLSRREKTVALVLATRMDARTGRDAYPSVRRLAAEADYSRRSVQSALKELTLAGWLVATRRQGTTTNYDASIPPQGGAVAAPPRDRGCNPRAKGGATAAPGGRSQEHSGGLAIAPEVALEVVPEDIEEVPLVTDEPLSQLRPSGRRALRRDHCVRCEEFGLVDGDGLCERCWRDEVGT
jgi:hypothetical protein